MSDFKALLQASGEDEAVSVNQRRLVSSYPALSACTNLLLSQPDREDPGALLGGKYSLSRAAPERRRRGCGVRRDSLQVIALVLARDAPEGLTAKPQDVQYDEHSREE